MFFLFVLHSPFTIFAFVLCLKYVYGNINKRFYAQMYKGRIDT